MWIGIAILCATWLAWAVTSLWFAVAYESRALPFTLLVVVLSVLWLVGMILALVYGFAFVLHWLDIGRRLRSNDSKTREP